MHSYTAATFLAAFSFASAQFGDAELDALAQCAQPCMMDALESLNCDLTDYTCLCDNSDRLLVLSTECLTDNDCISTDIDISDVLDASKDQLDQVCKELNTVSPSSPIATSDDVDSSFNSTTGATATGSSGSATATGFSSSGSSLSGTGDSSSGSGSTSGSVDDSTSDSINAPVTTSLGSRSGVHFSLAAVTVGLVAVLSL